MNKLRLSLLLSILLLLVGITPAFAQEGDWPRTLIDGLGTEVVISAPPQKIASVSLGADEVLLPLIGVERFVGVTQLTLDPGISNVAQLAAQAPNAIAAAADTEFIISLQPDIVFVASFTDQAVIQQLRDAGLTVFATGFPIGLEPIRENIRLLAQAVGAEAEAETMIAAMDADLEAVAQAVGAPEMAVRALYLTPGNYTSGIDSTISEVITAAGGVDVAAAAGVEQFSPLNDEFIIEQDPDVILLSGWTPWDPTFIDLFKNNAAFSGLSAVQNNRVYIANDAHLTTVSQFITEGVEDTAAYLYPDLYPAFPLTVIDAAGNAVSIDERPDTILIAPQADIMSPQDRLLTALPNINVIYAADEMTADASEIDVAFLNAADMETHAAALESVDTVVRLHDSAGPADDVANIVLMGDALGARIAALEAAAVYTDQLEAAAAGQQ